MQVSARDAYIVLLAALGGSILEKFDAAAILYKRLTVTAPAEC